MKKTLRVTLSYLCTSDSQVTYGPKHKISPTTMGNLDHFGNLSGKMLCPFIKAPTSKKEWLDNAIEFDNRWDFPHSLGALDVNYIITQAASRSGSTFFSSKKSFSIVLLAVCNTNFEFTLADIDEAGQQSDGGI